jgi:phosphorylase kinase alpha/beta subunit
LSPQAAVQTGYGNVWVRDNIYVALAQDVAGRPQAAVKAIEAIAAFYKKHSWRFEAIIDGQVDPNVPMNRPHIKFDGFNLAEIPEPWPHAQNDALGYFLWLYCRFALAGKLVPDGELLALFAFYFDAIRYWQDEDSGHWEETRKIEASSIGAVVAGLRELRTLLGEGRDGPAARKDRMLTPEFIDWLASRGLLALDRILPAECVQTGERKHRRYDAALLFLIYPLEVVDQAMGRKIVENVACHLQGENGIKRYLGDSYWTADFKERVVAAKLTADVSLNQEERDTLARPGEEAQWCIFDPIISVISGRWYLLTREEADLERQTLHLNRSLGQLTGLDCPQGELLCPEAYYLSRSRYVQNDHTPLLWTIANLSLALSQARLNG